MIRLVLDKDGYCTLVLPHSLIKTRFMYCSWPFVAKWLGVVDLLLPEGTKGDVKVDSLSGCQIPPGTKLPPIGS